MNLYSFMSDPRYRIKSERDSYNDLFENIEMVIELVRAYYGLWLGLYLDICTLMWYYAL